MEASPESRRDPLEPVAEPASQGLGSNEAHEEPEAEARTTTLMMDSQITAGRVTGR